MKMIRLDGRPSLLQQYLTEMRDAGLQQDALRFRTNAARCGEIMAYEISKTLPFEEVEIHTPLGDTRAQRLQSQPLICPVLRAGLAMHQGVLNFFDRAESAFIAAFRKADAERNIEVDVEYCTSPPLDGRDVLLLDPMLATGSSLLKAYEVLCRKGRPRALHIAVIIASEKGVETLQRYFEGQDRVTLWAAAIDPVLNKDYYIVPGLGDAGDLAFGERS